MATAEVGVSAGTGISPTAVRSEILCFVSSKTDIMAFDHIVKICTDFYRESEIIDARSLLEKCGISMHKRKGPEKIRSTVEDITKVMLNPSTPLPSFYAIDISRLPPVDVKHCDVSAILSELQALRAELRNMSNLQEEVKELRQQVNELRHADSLHGKCDTDARLHDSFADKAFDLQKTGMASRPPVRASANAEERPRSNSTRKAVIGASATSKHVVSVKTIRSVNIFVSRCHPHTANSMLTECISDAKGNIEIHGLQCTKLKSRYEHLYSSFHVQVQVSSLDFMKAVELFMSADIWPADLLVRRYFPPKNGGE